MHNRNPNSIKLQASAEEDKGIEAIVEIPTIWFSHLSATEAMVLAEICFWFRPDKHGQRKESPTGLTYLNCGFQEVCVTWLGDLLLVLPKEWAKKFGICRGTIINALARLEAQGFIRQELVTLTDKGRIIGNNLRGVAVCPDRIKELFFSPASVKKLGLANNGHDSRSCRSYGESPA